MKLSVFALFLLFFAFFGCADDAPSPPVAAVPVGITFNRLDPACTRDLEFSPLAAGENPIVRRRIPTADTLVPKRRYGIIEYTITSITPIVDNALSVWGSVGIRIQPYLAYTNSLGVADTFFLPKREVKNVPILAYYAFEVEDTSLTELSLTTGIRWELPQMPRVKTYQELGSFRVKFREEGKAGS